MKTKNILDAMIDLLIPLVGLLACDWILLHTDSTESIKIGAFIMIGFAVWVGLHSRKQLYQKRIREAAMCFAQIEHICRSTSRGIHKRIDENRELMELLQKEAPDLLKRCSWIEGWLESQDRFLCELASASKVESPIAHNYPRRWPERNVRGNNGNA